VLGCDYVWFCANRCCSKYPETVCVFLKYGDESTNVVPACRTAKDIDEMEKRI